MPSISKEALEGRLEEFLINRPFPGLRTRASRAKFAEKLKESQKKLRALRLRNFKGSLDPSSKDFHPFRTILHYFENGQPDEAIWLLFLCTHFGHDMSESVRLFYGKFGGGRWDWRTVTENPKAICDWMRNNPENVKHLKFGNHRKYETNDPESPIGTPAVILSFVQWAESRVNSGPYRALQCSAKESSSPQQAFEQLFRAFNVVRFGRTARFDFLCLVGNLGLLSVAPGHCYLKGATGPKNGALRMVTGRRGSRLSAAIEKEVIALQEFLAVPVEAMEDALCNWQKRSQGYRLKELEDGFLSVSCR